MKKLAFTFLFLLLLSPSVLAEPKILDYGFEPSFSLDGRMIAYASMEMGYRDIFVVDELGVKKRLTSDIYWDGQPVFTPDGRNVVFVSDRTGNRELWQAAISGKNLRQLTAGEGWKSYPSVSTSGRIAFTSGRHPHLDIYVLEDGAVKRLTYLEDEIYSPVWSPDGEEIAFVNGEVLMIINADGTGLEKIASGVYSRGISWGEDGKIVYLARNLGYDVWSVAAEDPGNPKLIYEGVTDSWEVSPAISSRGEIAFSSDKDGFYTIYVLDVTLPPAQLTAPPVPVVAPALEPAPSSIPSENPAGAGQPSSDVEEEMTRDKSRNENEIGDREFELPEHPLSDQDKIILPDLSIEKEIDIEKNGKNEIEVPESPDKAKDEIIIPEPAASEDREIIMDEAYQGFLLLAAFALVTLFIKKLVTRKPSHSL
jgi:hypothetical protein